MPAIDPCSLDLGADDPRTALLRLLSAFSVASAADTELTADFVAFVREHGDCFERSLAIGHVTGSAWLVSGDHQRVLLTHHRKLDRWLQPGGHADGDPDIVAVALREAEEESGLTDLHITPNIFDLDRHWIPPRGAEAGHWHYDVRFIVRALGSEVFAVSAESHALAWREIVEIAGDAGTDVSLRRMAARWLQAGD